MKGFAYLADFRWDPATCYWGAILIDGFFAVVFRQGAVVD